MENQKGYGIGSLVCGIISLCCCCCNEWFSIVLGVVAIVLFVLERVLAKQRSGMAIAGLICGICAIVISIFGLALYGILESAGVFEMYESMLSEYGFDISNMSEF